MQMVDRGAIKIQILEKCTFFAQGVHENCKPEGNYSPPPRKH